MSSPLLPSAHLSFANVLFLPIKPQPNCIKYPGRQLTLNLLDPKLFQESHTMDGFVFFAYKMAVKLHPFSCSESRISFAEPKIAQTGLFDDAGIHQTN